MNWAEAMENQDTTNEPAPFTKVERKRRRPLAQEIKATRKNIPEARAQQTMGTMDHCVYVEHCPESSQQQYVLVGLATKALAERLIEEGLEIEDTLLKT
ncbi:hypothetical protein LAZ67_2006510 [Cordylochernes scorpioides]|uniref:Uncharacterized protein n=1 Tax=Cordylochernes scorpioides TaxID=51811 RepID=A0ABY6K5E0_9ARAC|nr:hypothetical protein LAZ67_2006510 [Cordylochernes scorpioides]